MQRLIIRTFNNPPTNQDLDIIKPILKEYEDDWLNDELRLKTQGKNIYLDTDDPQLHEIVAGSLTAYRIPFKSKKNVR